MATALKCHCWNRQSIWQLFRQYWQNLQSFEAVCDARNQPKRKITFDSQSAIDNLHNLLRDNIALNKHIQNNMWHSNNNFVTLSWIPSRIVNSAHDQAVNAPTKHKKSKPNHLHNSCLKIANVWNSQVTRGDPVWIVFYLYFYYLGTWM